MAEYATEAIRNIALVGQSGAGKTSLVDAMLVRTAAPGERGPMLGTDLLERAYGHSLNAAVVSFDHDRVHLNVIDTPGLPDLIGRALGVFPAVETVVAVLDANTGVDPLARRLLDWAAERGLCRLIVINKIDAEGLDLPALVDGVRKQFGPECLPLNLPADAGERVADCFFNPDGRSDFSSVAEAHTRIVDQVVEMDEDLMALYLEQGEALSPGQLHEPFERALREGHLMPMCFVSARTGAGVAELVRTFARLMPNPHEGNPPPFLKGEGAAAVPYPIAPDPDRHVVAHVFKVMVDPYVGKLGVFRIHQGTVTRDSQLFVGDGRKPFRAAHVLRLQAGQQSEVDVGVPGDICAVAKVEELHFDAVLHDSHDEDYLHARPLQLPVPVFGLAVAAGRRGEEQRLATALQRVVEEDPCLRLERHAGLNETVLRGLGDLHLRIALDTVKQRFGIEAATRPPKIPYRETISRRAEGHYRHKKQTGGAGQFGEVFLRVEPLARGAGLEFVDEVRGGAIPSVFVPAVEKGVHQAMQAGALAGYPLQDMRVVVTDGKHHAVDSKEVAFVTAGRRAFLDAVGKAVPLVLEPMVGLDLQVPGACMGAVTADLSAKRGHVSGSNALPGGRIAVQAVAPLAELAHYADELRSLTGGEGVYTLAFSHYEPLPVNLQKALVAESRPAHEEDSG